ncbi:MAG: plasmid replication, integration and excision activator [Phycicoccus sp.]|nr:plasmid replication, integration and excision activator [Phycicoccus sp.]
MAIARRFKIGHDEVFPFGAYLVAEVGPVFDYDKSSKDAKVQQVDKDNGLPLWSVEVLDADPEAGKKSKTVTVKIAARVQPVPPEALPGLPFRPVVFQGLSALPYIDDAGKFSRIVWSFKAEAMTAPGKSDATTAPGKPDASSSKAA